MAAQLGSGALETESLSIYRHIIHGGSAVRASEHILLRKKQIQIESFRQKSRAATQSEPG